MTSKPFINLAIFALLSLQFVTPSVAKDTFKWRDNDGKLNITDNPPPSSCYSADCKRIYKSLADSFNADQLKKMKQVEEKINQRKLAEQEYKEFLSLQKKLYLNGYDRGISIRNKYDAWAKGNRHCGRIRDMNSTDPLVNRDIALSNISIQGCIDGFDHNVKKYR